MMAPRLLLTQGPGLAEHRQRFGELPSPDQESLITSLNESGLTGRGGAGFPTGRKLASITRRKPVVIGNGAEGEPLSSKDSTLLTLAPHLVLDGLSIVSTAVAADTVFIYVPKSTMPTVQMAIDERAAAKVDRHRVTVVEAPDTFVAGEESSVIRRIEGGPALPRDRTELTTTSGVRGKPTLVNNVETLAHIALIARYGPTWFRSVGDPTQPGTMLVTLSGAHRRRSVIETPTGVPLRDIISRGGLGASHGLRAVLLGGYHGSWISADVLHQAHLSREGLAKFGATPGAGVVHGLGRDECGLERTAEISAYLAEQSAGQCGPCLNGLPRLYQLLDQLAFGHVDDALVDEVHRMLGMLDGRGSCRHPDGTTRFVRTALSVFASDIAQHRRGYCEALITTGRELRTSG